MPDSFDCYRRFMHRHENSTFVVLANEREYSNGRNILHDVIHKDEQPRLGTFDRGRWMAQGIANTLGRHVFLYSESSSGSSCGPVFPIDADPCWYPDEGGYSKYLEEVQKEGRWQGDKGHPKYPWRKENHVLS